MSTSNEEFNKILMQMKNAEIKAQAEKSVMKSKTEQMLEGFIVWLFYVFVLILAGFLFKLIVSISMLIAGIIFIILFDRCCGEWLKKEIKKFLENEKLFNMFKKK